MIHKFQYESKEERDLLIEQNKDKRIVEEWDIVEGKFILFDDTPSQIDLIKELEKKLEQSNLAQLEVSTTIFEELMTLKGGA